MIELRSFLENDMSKKEKAREVSKFDSPFVSQEVN